MSQLIVSGVTRRPPCAKRAGELVTALAGLSGLSVIFGPVSLEAAGKVHSMCIIAESHIAFECDPVSGAYYLSVFSCRPVPSSVVRAAFEELQPVRWRIGLIKRTELEGS